jgi:hypothetical protein
MHLPDSLVISGDHGPEFNRQKVFLTDGITPQAHQTSGVHNLISQETRVLLGIAKFSNFVADSGMSAAKIAHSQRGIARR